MAASRTEAYDGLYYKSLGLIFSLQRTFPLVKVLENKAFSGVSDDR